MSDFLDRLGFPVPEQWDSIRFYFAKWMGYRTRRNVILGCLLLGLAWQAVTIKFWPGIIFLLIAVGLGLVKGYDSRIRLKSFKNDETWTEAPIEKVREIESIGEKSRKWDRDSLDLTNSLGCLTFIGGVALGVFLCVLAGIAARDVRVTTITLGDFIVLVIPFYFTGVRRALKQGNLSIKVKLLLKLHTYFEQHRIESETFVPMLLLAHDKDGSTVPADVRFRIRYKGLPPDCFFGLQGTININLVQGTSFPYFYCVLVAKPGFGLANYKSKVRESKHVFCEYQEQSDAEVLVIRHPTTKNSGFNTDENASIEILGAAMGAARIMEYDKKPGEGGEPANQPDASS